MNCPKCQNPLAPNARFCGVCGQPVAAAPSPERVAAAPSGTGASGASAATASWSVPPPSLPALPGLLERIKNILLTPRAEWPIIASEPTVPAQLFVGYVAPLALLAAVMAFIHVSLIGVSMPFGGALRTPVLSGVITAAMTVVFACVGVFLIGVIINFLAPTFGGTRDLRQALKCSAYSLTPAYLGAVLALSPVMATLLQLLAGCYGLYVLGLGLPVLMRSPKERAVGYTATVVVCTFLLGIVFTFASMALGIAGHASGLMGSNEVSQQQSAEAVGNIIGGALGTDAKGKAGLSAALNNLVKAGEQSEAATGSAKAPDAPAATTTAAGSNSAGAGGSAANTTAQNPAAAVGGLMNALGGALGGDHPVAVVDFHALTALLPTTVAGMKRTDARGESQGAMGVKTASATGMYQGDNGTRIQVEITDMSAVSGLMGLAGSMVQSTTSESTTGFERDQAVGGRTVHERFDNAAKHGVLTALVAKRYQVELTGEGVEMGTLEQALGGVDLGRLEAMKDQGGPAK